MKLTPLTFLFLGKLVSILHQGNAQHNNHVSFPLDIHGEVIDLQALDDGTMGILSTDAWYLFDGRTFQRQPYPEGVVLTKPSQTFSSRDHTRYYPGYFDGFYTVHNCRVMKDFEEKTRPFIKGAVVQSDEGLYWLAEKNINVHDNASWNVFHDLENNQSTFWDGKADTRNVWFAHFGEGVFNIDEEHQLKNYKKADGLFKNEATALCIGPDDTVYVGHVGGLSLIDPDGTVQAINLASIRSSQPILEMEFSPSGTFWAMTDHTIIRRPPGGAFESLEFRPDQTNEELVALEVDRYDNIWVISNHALYLVPYSSLKRYSLDGNISSRAPILYTIRNNNYIASGKKIYKYNASGDAWVLDRKKTSLKSVTRDREGHSWLTNYQDQAMLVHKDNAQILKESEMPSEIVTKVVDDYAFFICTEKNLYVREGSEFRRLNDDEEAFFNVIPYAENKALVFGTNGIQSLVGQELAPIPTLYKKLLFPRTQNQILVQDSLIIAAFNEGLLKLNMKDFQNSTVFQLEPLKVMDIIEDGEAIWLLSQKSLLQIKTASIIQGYLSIEKEIPLWQKILNGRLFIDNRNDLWITSPQVLFKVDRAIAGKPGDSSHIYVSKVVDNEGMAIPFLPEANILKIDAKSFPVSIAFAENNFTSTYKEYSFNLYQESIDWSEWSDDNTLRIAYLAPGKYILKTKIRNDVSGREAYGDAITIEVTSGKSSRHLDLLVPGLIAISMIGMFLLWRRRRVLSSE